MARDDRTDELKPEDLPAFNDTNEGDDLGGPTEMMDRKALMRDWPMRARGFDPPRDTAPPPSDRTAFVAMEPVTVPPPSDRTAFVAIDPVASERGFGDDPPNTVHTNPLTPFVGGDSFEQPDETMAIGMRFDDLANTNSYETDDLASVSAQLVPEPTSLEYLGEHVPHSEPALVNEPTELFTSGAFHPEGARRPPTPPASKRTMPTPRRPSGLSSPDAPPASAHTTVAANPFLAPPSKFFQASGPGRSKPRESTIDLDPDELPPPSPPRAPSPLELELQRIPGAPVAAPLSAAPASPRLPAPSRAVGPPRKAAAPEPPPAIEFDYELEVRLRERQDWLRLVELYTSPALRSESERRDHWLQAAEILRDQLGELERAFSVGVDVLELEPTNAEAAVLLEKIAVELGVHAKARWADAVRRLKKAEGQTPDPDRRVEYLALLFRWNTNELRRRDIAAEVLTRLSELAPRHPIVLERRANEARARGDAEQQRQLLLEALSLLTRADDQIRVHLALAELFEGPLALRAHALPHYQAVLDLEPDHIDALRGLERALREAHDPDRLREVQERIVAAAQTPKDKLEPLIRLAETLEKELESPEAAAEILEDALGIDGDNAKALAALERCREALGHWSDVARVMQRRAALLTAPRAKLDLLFSSADVLEKRAYDVQGALDTYRLVLSVDGKNRRALGEMRRLAEDLSDWDQVVSLATRLAEVTPDKREAARLFFELGEQLEERDDHLLARTQFERALELDKRNRAVHAALERLARAASQDERARHFLEQRAKLEGDKAEAAELYTQLGRERFEVGDEDAAMEAFQLAHQANPAQEEAAAALLEWYVGQNNFRAVEPLLQGQITAARREGDRARVLQLLRLATRTAASLGKIDAALQASMAAFDEAPDDAGARADFLEVTTRVPPERLLIARDHLARIASSIEDMDTLAIVQLGEAQFAAGDARRAILTLEQAHDQNPTDPLPLEAIEPILEAEQLWERLANAKLERARMLPLSEEELHFRLLAEAGDLWARRLSDVRAASEAFEEARVLRPDDGWLLDTLAWAYREIGEWHKLAEVLDTLAAGAETPSKEREILLELATVQAKELRDLEAAAITLNRVLDSDPDHLQAFEDLVRMHTDQRDWAGLERAYRKMLLRVQNKSGADALLLALWKQLGLVYRDRLGQNQSAIEAFVAALAIAPADEELHRIVVELHLLLGDLDGAIEQARARVQHAPFEPETYATLYDLFLRKSAYDLAWCALDVMAQLVQLEGEEEQLYLSYPPYPMDQIPGTITEEAWRTHLLDSEMDATLTSLFAWATPAEVRLMGNTAIYAGILPFDPNLSESGAALTAIIENGAEILGMINPQLFLAERAAMPLRPASAPLGAFLVDPALANAEQDALAFHVGRGLSWLRSELMPLAFFPMTKDLSNFLARLVRQDPDLYFSMTEEERQTVTNIIDQATADGAKFDVRRWTTLAHASAARAAVLLTGSVHEAAVFYSRAEDDENATEKLTALYQFAVSDEHTELRSAIGTAISAG